MELEEQEEGDLQCEEGASAPEEEQEGQDVPEGEVEFVCFGEMVKGTHFFTMSQTTHLASPLPLLLLCVWEQI